MSKKFIELTGAKIGRWTVIERAGTDKWGSVLWKCICECGNEKLVRGVELKKGTSQSCGCLNQEQITKHGMYKSRPYKIWQGMKTRCTNSKQPNHERYGKRGITYNPRWESFENFWEDMGESYQDGLTIDRKNNQKGYSKDNCRWVTPHEQNKNMRSNVYLNHKGKKSTVEEISEQTGLLSTTIYNRRQRGWTDDKIINTSIIKKFANKK